MAENKIIKVNINRSSEQCSFTIPRKFWDEISKSGYYEVTVKKGVFIYTPVAKLIVKKRGKVSLPVLDDDLTENNKPVADEDIL